MSRRGWSWIPGTADADARLERILDPSRRPGLTGPDAALADLFTATRSPATHDELTGLDAAMALFIARSAAIAVQRCSPPARSARRLATVPVATLLAAGGLLAVGGAAAAAYTGALPSGLQELAHRAFGAPTPQVDPGPPVPPGGDAPAPPENPGTTGTLDPTTSGPTPTTSPSSTDVGPTVPLVATDPAVPGLCQAFLSGGLDREAAAYRLLVDAAGGLSVAEYCGEVVTTPATPATPTHPVVPTPTHPKPTHPTHPVAPTLDHPVPPVTLPEAAQH